MKTNYQELFKKANSSYIPDNGKEVVVGVLDSGIFAQHNDLSGAIKIPSDWNIGGFTVGDNYGHGSHMAGIIGGRTYSDSGILGFSPESIIYDFKIVESEYINNENVVEALNKINNENIHVNVINMSLNIDIDEDYYLNKLVPILDKLHEKGIVMVCAAGDNDELTGQGILTPAIYENAISIGTIERENWNKFQNEKFHNNLDYFFVNSSLRSCLSQNNTIQKGKFYGNISGSSPHTAIVSGIIASKVNFTNSKPSDRLSEALKYLDSIATNNCNVQNGNTMTLYKPN